MSDETAQAYQVTLKGHGAFSAPYLDEEKAEESAQTFEENTDLGEFYVEENNPGWSEQERQRRAEQAAR